MIGDTEYAINSDFRVSVLYEMMVQDDSISDVEKIHRAILLYFEEPPEEDIEDIVEAIIWFYRCGRGDKEQREQRRSSDGSDEPREPQAYSFDYDDEYIYAAFLQQYGIDLVEVEDLHWWKFRAMFKALTDCQFVKIMGYRTQKITGEMSNAEKAMLRKMKALYALPLSDSEREENDALTDALLNGGDLTGLL